MDFFVREGPGEWITALSPCLSTLNKSDYGGLLANKSDYGGLLANKSDYGGLLANKPYYGGLLANKPDYGGLLVKAHNCTYIHIIVNNYVVLTHTVNDIFASKAHNCNYLNVITNYLHIISIITT